MLAKQLRLDVAQLTDVGRRREHNEDNMAFVIPKDPLVMANKGALFIVADGMGGHAAGEVASEIAVDTVSNMYYQDDSEEVGVSLLRAIRRANASIHQRAAENMLRTGMGTTCVAAVLRGNIAYIANVGDSRAYLLRGNQVVQITRDHSWVAEQVRAGLLTEDQARTHTQRNVITRCLGTQAEVDIDVFHEELNEGDSFVLCTDGLSGLVSDEELLRIVEQFVPQESVYHLVERANENGGPDNITAIVARVQEVGEETPGMRYPVGVGGREKGEDTLMLGLFSDSPLGTSGNNGDERTPSAPLRLSSGPLISSPDSITAPQPVLGKPQSKRGRLFYPALALIALLVITLAGGGAFFFLRANDSQAVNRVLDTTQQQISNTQAADPASALKALSTAQKTLGDIQNNHPLDGTQMQRVTDLQNLLVSQVNAAISTYNQNAGIFLLTCPSNPINNNSTQTYAQSIVYAQNAKSEPFLYSLARDNNLYEVNKSGSQYGMVSSLPLHQPSPNFLSLASNGSFLFLLEKRANNYFLNVFQPGQQGVVSATGAPAQISSTFTDGGYVPAFITAWGTNVYVMFSSPSDLLNPRIVSYVLDTKGHLNTPRAAKFSISAPIVSIAAFPDQLFLLLSSGDVQSMPLVSGSQPSPPPVPVLVQSPIALPLATNGFTISDPVPTVTTVTSNNQQGTAALSIPSPSPTSTAMLTVGLINHTPHLYIGDPMNQRVLDLIAASGAQGSPTPTPTGTTVAASSVKLQLVQQYVSSADLSQVKSLAVDPQGTKLTVLSQKALPMVSLVSINTTQTGCI